MSSEEDKKLIHCLIVHEDIDPDQQISKYIYIYKFNFEIIVLSLDHLLTYFFFIYLII